MRHNVIQFTINRFMFRHTKNVNMSTMYMVRPSSLPHFAHCPQSCKK